MTDKPERSERFASARQVLVVKGTSPNAVRYVSVQMGSRQRLYRSRRCWNVNVQANESRTTAEDMLVAYRYTLPYWEAQKAQLGAK